MNENNITYLVGHDCNFNNIKCIKPFDDILISFFDELSVELLHNPEPKKYPDIVTFAFYIRKANVLNIKNKNYVSTENCVKFGRGVVFHVAPSNVPVNFAYSLFAGLICGNSNIVKVSSKDFPQVKIICDAINKILDKFETLRNCITIVRYNNEKDINDYFSSICDIRVIWGGDKTIAMLRESPLKPRAREITFADRYSLLVVDSKYYDSLSCDDKKKVAISFYNDTFLTDQNACTSPRLICFINGYSEDFYKYSLEEVRKKYDFNDIIGSDKLVEVDKFAIDYKALNPKLERINNENFIYKISVDKVSKSLINFKGNSGLFVECKINDIRDIIDICDDDRVQTISYVGEKTMFDSLINLGLKGIDRIVPIGKTMDFDFIWDGYNLFEMFTKNISIS